MSEKLHLPYMDAKQQRQFDNEENNTTVVVILQENASGRPHVWAKKLKICMRIENEILRRPCFGDFRHAENFGRKSWKCEIFFDALRKFSLIENGISTDADA